MRLNGGEINLTTQRLLHALKYMVSTLGGFDDWDNQPANKGGDTSAV